MRRTDVQEDMLPGGQSGKQDMRSDVELGSFLCLYTIKYCTKCIVSYDMHNVIS